MHHFKHMPQMLQVMTPFPYHVDIGAPLTEVARLMKEHGIRHLPVTRDGDIESIISQRDLLRTQLPGSQGEMLRELVTGDVCPARAYCVDVGDPLDHVLQAMSELHIGAVIVLRDGELAGIFTESDAFKLLSAELAERFRHSEPPEAA